MERTRSDFVVPITSEDIQPALTRPLSEFIDGIKAVLAPSGSKKQIKVVRSLFSMGSTGRSVFLHTCPRTEMIHRYDRSLNPSVLREYHRAGALVEPHGTGDNKRRHRVLSTDPIVPTLTALSAEHQRLAEMEAGWAGWRHWDTCASDSRLGHHARGLQPK